MVSHWSLWIRNNIRRQNVVKSRQIHSIMPAKKKASSKPATKRAVKKSITARSAKVAPKKRATPSSGASKKKMTSKAKTRKTAAQKTAKNTTTKKITKKTAEVKTATVPVKHKPRYEYALAFILTLSAILLIGYTARIVTAAEFAEPPGGPSEGNIPVTVWNRDATVIGSEGGIWPEKQQDTSINIDGQIYFGDVSLQLANDGVPQYGLYGQIHYYDGLTGITYMGSEDYFIKMDATHTNYPGAGDTSNYSRFYVNRGGTLYGAGGGSIGSYFVVGSSNKQMLENGSSTYIYQGLARFDETSPGGDYYADPDLDYFLWMKSYDYTGSPDVGYTDRFTVDVTGDVWASEDIKADGCFGPSFIGLTVTGGQGGGVFRPQDVAGYYGGNNRCQVDYPDYEGTHVCQISELLESIKCSEPGDAFRSVLDGTRAWVNGGPPGHISNYNDCEGWSSSSADSYARYWIFDTITGGRGTGVSCNTVNGLQFACCY